MGIRLECLNADGKFLWLGHGKWKVRGGREKEKTHLDKVEGFYSKLLLSLVFSCIGKTYLGLMFLISHDMIFGVPPDLKYSLKIYIFLSSSNSLVIYAH